MAKKSSSGKSGNQKSRPRSSSSARASAAQSVYARLAWATVFLLLAVFSALNWFHMDGTFLVFLEQFGRHLAGWGWWSLPPALFLCAGLLFSHRTGPVWGRVFCALALPVLLGAAAHTLAGDVQFLLLKKGLLQLWQLAGADFTGGVLGGAIAVLLVRAFSRIGALLILLLICLLAVLALTRTSPDVVLDHMAERREQRREERQAHPRERRRFHLLPPEMFDPEEDDPQEEVYAEPVRELPARPSRRPRIRDYDLDVDDPPLPQEPPETPEHFHPEPSEEQDTLSAVLAKGTSRFFSRQSGVSTPAEYLARTEQPPPAKKKKPAEPPDQQVQVQEELVHAASEQAGEYHFPSLDLLKQLPGASSAEAGKELKHTETLLSDTIHSFGIDASIVEVTRGPSVTRYELELERGIKLSKLTNLAGDIALSLGAVSVRIAPIPGKKSVVGVEVPNRVVTPVPIRSVIDSPEFHRAASPVSFAVGKDISNRNVIGDIAKLPHMLIAGTTGSGKSVCTNSLIISLLYKSSPKDVRLIMVDPKMVELGIYNGIPHLLIPVVTDPKKAAGALQWAVFEMMRRYQLFANRGVRELESYNKVVSADPADEEEPLPKIVIVIDELADLMLVAAKEVEESICRVAQMGRAAGMHLIIATQRPSSDVITGLMKANIPSRIAFAVASSIESRIILDTTGAEKLVGKGDMLFAPLGKAKRRVQGCLISDEEVSAVIDEIKQHSVPSYSDEVMSQVEENAKKNEKGGKGGASAMNVAPPDGPETQDTDDGRDPLYCDAVDVVVETGMASVSMLQRRLKLGYSRAARLVDQMEEYGVVGPFEGSKPRKVLVSKDRWEEMKMKLSSGSSRGAAMDLAKVMSAAADSDLPPFDADE